MTADMLMFEPHELFNLLHQRRSVSRLAEINYLCLIDAREATDYYNSHIITAKNAKMNSQGKFLLPEVVEVDSMQHVVVYDSNTSCLLQGRAVDCAQVLNEVSLHPVLILNGGFQRFSALYPFLRTEKILYTITELENLKIYPVEIIEGLLFMGDEKQGMDSSILGDLKIRALVNISETDTLESESMKGNRTILKIPIADSLVSDLYSNFEKICSFIDSHINRSSRVLIVSKQGRSRCSAATIAFLMHHCNYALQEAWKFLLKCKPTIRPNRGFLQQLSDWELLILGTRHTDLEFTLKY
ncbi:serine/threonine/tyrosine-interacting-like protein 1 [Pholidichthys leucotaenia]